MLQGIHNNLLEFNPSQSPRGTIIWLHGLGATGHDFEPIVSYLNQSTHLPLRSVCPNAPMRAVTLNQGLRMPAWFDIYELRFSFEEENDIPISRIIDEKGLLQAEKTIHQLIENEEKRGIPASQIILAGFSQGGALALFTGLRYPKTLKGLLGLSSYLPLTTTFDNMGAISWQEAPILLTHGTQDPLLPLEVAQKTYEVLKSRHYNIQLLTYPGMQHEFCSKEIEDIIHWIYKLYIVK